MSDLPYQNGVDQDIEELPINDISISQPASTDGPSTPKHVFQNGMVYPIAEANHHSDLTGNIHLSKIWMRQFGKSKEDAEEGWKQFRWDAVDQYEAFESKLTDMEGNLNDREDNNDDDTDAEVILQKLDEIDTLCVQIDQCDKEFTAVSMTYEKFATYLPNGDNRKKVNGLIETLTRRYFNFLLALHRKREIVHWVITRLKRFAFSGNDIKNWLSSIESRSKFLFTNPNMCMLSNEERVQQLVEEIHMKREVYEDFMEPGKGFLDVDHQMKLDKLQEHVNEIVPRWDALCENIENCLHRIIMEKKALALQNKSEMEKIDIKVRDEIEKCTCDIPFKIVKVGDGKYTFGSSKTVRLLRIHGSSIVVRIGGGWEYLSNFLLKVDPCRAKQHVTIPPNKGLDTENMFSMLGNQESPITVPATPTRRKSAVAIPRHLNRSSDISGEPRRRSSVVLPPKHMNRTVDIITEPDDKLLNIAKPFNSLNSSQTAVSRSRSKLNPNNSSGGSGDKSKGSCDDADGTFGWKPDGKIDKPENKTRRVSLMERQTLYAQKRHYKSVDIDF